MAAIMEATGGQGVQYALDTSGKSSSMQSAVAGLAPLGVCGMVAPGLSSIAYQFLICILFRRTRSDGDIGNYELACRQAISWGDPGRCCGPCLHSSAHWILA